MKHIVVTLILFSFVNLIYGQTADPGVGKSSDCLSTIQDADKLFQDGLYDKCINSLEGVLNNCSLSRSENLSVLELLAKAYIETDDLGKAETNVYLMLTIFPHYELKEPANSEVYNRMVKKFIVRPRFSIGVRNAANWSNFNTTKVFSVLDGLDYSAPYKTNYGVGFDLGYGLAYYGWAELEFDKYISLNADLTFMWSKYERNINEAPSFSLSFWETNKYFEIPVYLKKYFPVGKNVLPYATVGMAWLYMTQADGNATISYTMDDIITGKDQDFSSAAYNIDMLEMRNRNTFRWMAGIGIGYKMKNIRLFVDARYYGGINSFTYESKQLSNTMLINDYFYIDNSVKLNQFELGASISYTLKNSVKRIKK